MNANEKKILMALKEQYNNESEFSDEFVNKLERFVKWLRVYDMPEEIKGMPGNL